jgi:hypothetical protein
MSESFQDMCASLRDQIRDGLQDTEKNSDRTDELVELAEAVLTRELYDR